MALTSDSTLQDALDQYNDNLDWHGSPTRARLALEAVRYLIVNRPQSTPSISGSLNYEQLLEVQRELRRYLDAVSTPTTARRSSLVRGKPIL